MNKTNLARTISCIMLALACFQSAHASEVTGKLSTSASGGTGSHKSEVVGGLPAGTRTGDDGVLVPDAGGPLDHGAGGNASADSFTAAAANAVDPSATDKEVLVTFLSLSGLGVAYVLTGLIRKKPSVGA